MSDSDGHPGRPPEPTKSKAAPPVLLGRRNQDKRPSAPTNPEYGGSPGSLTPRGSPSMASPVEGDVEAPSSPKKHDPSQDSLKNMDITEHMMDTREVYKRYGTDPAVGLTEEQVGHAREKYGHNELTPPKKTPWCVKFLLISCQGFSMLLWTGSVMCFIAYAVDRAQHGEVTSMDNMYLGVVLASVVLTTSVFTFYQEVQHEAIMESFKQMVPPSTDVIRDGEMKTLLVRDLVPGDIVKVKKGDRIPADMLIIEASSFKVDNSSLTGESEPVSKSNKSTDPDVFETENLSFFSTNAVEGTCTGLVIRTGDVTTVGRIASLATSTGASSTPIRREIHRFIKIISVIAVILGLSFGVFAAVVGYSVIESLLLVIGIIVANVPEGLLITVTVALTLTAKKMSQKNCLVKNVEAVETLGSTSLICSDKTGTLTQNKMTVTHMWFNLELVETSVTKNEYGVGFDSSKQGWSELAFAASLCSTAQFLSAQENVPIPDKEVSGDATEAGILKMISAITGEVEELRQKNPRVAEIPFSSSSKFHVSIHETGGGRHHMMIKGAPEKILDLSTSYLVNGLEKKIDDAFRAQFASVYESLGNMGLRVLGFCDNVLPADEFPPQSAFNIKKKNFPLGHNRFLGLMALMDPPKPNVPNAIAQCRSAGIRVMMLTGDHPTTAEAIARQVGIISPDSLTPEQVARGERESNHEIHKADAKARVISGHELAELSSDQLDEALNTYPEVVFARTTPEQKLLIVESNQRLGSIVAVTGDGVNDSPALKKADIGIAMGIMGSDVAKEAADMILLDDNFASIVSGVEEGRLIFDNLKKSIAYTLTSNIPEIAPFLAFIIFNIPLPLGTVTILFIDLGTDMIPAISLAHENAERDIMKRMPRDPVKDRLVNARLICLSYLIIGVIQALAGFFQYFVIMGDHGFLPNRLLGLRYEWDNPDINDLEDSYGQEWAYAERKALEYTCHTGFFLAIVQVQWACLIISKTRKVSIIEQGMRNHFLNFGLVFETLLATLLIYTPGTDTAFKMYALSPWYWLPALPFALLIVLLDEARRYFIRKYPNGFLFRLTYY